MSILTYAGILNSENNMTQEEFGKLKRGDKVRVKTNLIPHTLYNNVYFSHPMIKYKGKIVIVASKYNNSEIEWVDCCSYSLRTYYAFTKDMIDKTFIFGK